MVTAFVVIFTLALFLMAGLVLDGGLALAARVRAIDDAQAAAGPGPKPSTSPLSGHPPDLPRHRRSHLRSQPHLRSRSHRHVAVRP